MSIKQGFSLSRLINNFMTKLCGRKTEADYNDMMIECRNPWQHNLERLARVESRYTDETPTAQKTDSVASFVTDLAKATFAEETAKTEASKGDSQKVSDPASKKLANRLGDRTITDMKAWWQDSLGTTQVQGPGKAAQNEELPGKPRALKRWFE